MKGDQGRRGKRRTDVLRVLPVVRFLTLLFSILASSQIIILAHAGGVVVNFGRFHGHVVFIDANQGWATFLIFILAVFQVRWRFGFSPLRRFRLSWVAVHNVAKFVG